MEPSVRIDGEYKYVTIGAYTYVEEATVKPTWPVFLPNQLILGNPEANTAVICGWTQKELVKKRLEKIDSRIMDRVAGIGQLYTAERGVDMLVRNLLANPRINAIVLCGEDKSGSVAETHKFFNTYYELVVGQTTSGRKYYTAADGKARVWADIPIEFVEAVRRGVATHSPDSDEEIVRVVRALASYQASLGTTYEGIWGRHIFTPDRQEPNTFPAPDSVQVLRAKTIGEGWLDLLHHILRYGKQAPTHYDQDTLEIMDLVMVITEQDPDPKDIPGYLPFMLGEVDEYCVKLLSPVEDTAVSYTYGNRMRAYFQGRDQLMDTAKKLAEDRGARSAVINLWDSTKNQKSSPCLNHLWFRIIEGKLFMTATIRSNDMYQGWPKNAYGLRFLQEWVRCMVLKLECAFQDDKGLGLGDLVIVSQSAHVYEDCWAPAQDLVNEFRSYREWHDEKGQWTFEPVFDEGAHRVVKATLHSPGGEHLTTIQGSSTHVRRVIARRGLISDVGHALYVGQMLEKTARGFN